MSHGIAVSPAGNGCELLGFPFFFSFLFLPPSVLTFHLLSLFSSPPPFFSCALCDVHSYFSALTWMPYSGTTATHPPAVTVAAGHNTLPAMSFGEGHGHLPDGRHLHR